LYLNESYILNSSQNLDELCFKTKNLYNKANYIIRNKFINEGIYINRNKMYVDFKILSEFKEIGNARIARGVLRILDANWLSFFSAIKSWKKYKEKFTGKPNLPKYLKKDGRFNAIFFETSILKEKEGLIGFSQTDIRIKKNKEKGRLVEANLKPLKTKKFKLTLTYEVKEEILKEDNKRYCSIDLGVNNLMTLTSNVGISPKIINGRPLKSMNQFYNKQLSKFKSELPKKVYSSLKINKLTEKRNNKVYHYLHEVSKYVIDYCLENELNTIIVGYNEFWKQKVNMGKKNNQNFVQIPFERLVNYIEYKAKLNGIIFIKREESYTSKCSSLDLEEIKYHETYLGKRIIRGLFKTNSDKIINSDVNASLNIMRKAIPNVNFINGIEDCAVNPKRVKSFKYNY
jgi:putative transposase